jgi:O-antigen ligase
VTTSALRIPPLVELAARGPAWLVAIPCTVLAAGLGYLWLDRPEVATFVALPFAALPLVLSGQVRAFVFVFGSLAVFQSSDELTGQKLAFFFAVMIAFAAIIARLPELSQTPAYRDLTPMLRASIVLIALSIVSLLVSTVNEVPQREWLRDVSPYILIASAPLFALDAQASFSERSLRRLIVVGGTLGALAFTVTWLTNRGIADLSFVPIGLPTMLLPAAVFAFAMSVFLEGRSRLVWLALGAVVLAMMVATGTRTSLVLLAAPFAITFGGRRQLTRRSLRLLVAVPLVAVIGVAVAVGVIGVTGGDRGVLADRIEQISTTGEGVADRSYLDRVSQTEAAWALFRSAPLFGVGPGVPIEWTDSLGRPKSSPIVDSPASFLTKFGVVGLVAVGFLVAGYVSTLHRIRIRAGRRTVAQYALIGFGAVFACMSLLVNTFEDKGLSIGLALLLALAAREAGDRMETQGDAGGRS